MRRKPHLLSVVGARPQFIKLAPLAKVLSRGFRHTIVHTGQHYDQNMSGVFFKQLKIPRASINLSIGGVSHGAMTGRILEKLEELLTARKPDAVLVYGDTNTTLAGALAAAKLGVPVAHVEAGLRSFVQEMPEEINRRLTDHLSQLLFCPTSASIRNLRREGINKGLVPSGDLMYELLHDSRRLITSNTAVLQKFSLQPNKFALLTFHRASNVDDRDNLKTLCEVIESAPLPILFPVHPRTKKMLQKYHLASRLDRVKHLVQTDPLSYHDTLSSAHFAKVVLTDSGGLQKEAIFLGTPVLTLRNETEWVELLKKGNRLVGLDERRIHSGCRRPPKTGKIEYLVNRKRPSHIIASALGSYLKGA